MMMETRKLAKTLDKLVKGEQLVEPEKLAAMIAKVREKEGPQADLLVASTLSQFSSIHQGLREMKEQLTSPPWFPATFLGTAHCGDVQGAAVLCGNGRTVVRTLPELNLDGLRPGDEVYLNHERNLLVSRSSQSLDCRGETGVFSRWLGEDRLMVRCQDREQLVRAGGDLDPAELKVGDTLLFDPLAGIATQMIEPEKEHPYFLEELPSGLGPSSIGGQKKNLEQIVFALRALLLNQEGAERYGLGGRQSMLLFGPPGTGKTLMVRIAASMVAEAGGKKCLFANVKPSQFESAYVGETQRRIREFFAVVRRRAEDSMVVCFFDEVEGIGRIRGSHSGHHSDKFLASLLAEMEGFEGRSNVAIIAATNRKDLLDPALLQRLSEIEVEVKRPSLEAAREIFRIHFPDSLPFHPNGDQSNATREELIDSAVSQLFAPNGENEIARIRFQDSKERVVRASELVSGRILEQVSRDARMRAFRREDGGLGRGVRNEDVNGAVEATMEKMRSLLTIHNAHAYLSDLPQDVTVVSVEPIRRPAQQTNTYRMT